MTVYQTGHAKRDPATGSIALRTAFSEDEPVLAALAWIVASNRVGARHATTAEVDGWDDIYTPPSE